SRSPRLGLSAANPAPPPGLKAGRSSCPPTGGYPRHRGRCKTERDHSGLQKSCVPPGQPPTPGRGCPGPHATKKAPREDLRPSKPSAVSPDTVWEYSDVG